MKVAELGVLIALFNSLIKVTAKGDGKRETRNSTLLNGAQAAAGATSPGGPVKTDSWGPPPALGIQ